MSIKKVEDGFQMVSTALRRGQFTKGQLEFIVEMSAAIGRGAQSVLDKIAAKQKNVEAETQPPTRKG